MVKAISGFVCVDPHFHFIPIQLFVFLLAFSVVINLGAGAGMMGWMIFNWVPIWVSMELCNAEEKF